MEEKINIAYEIVEPWGIWIYIKDPSGNILCVTNQDIW